MLPSKEKPKENDKQAPPIGKPQSPFITVNHKDDKMILGDCLFKYFQSKDVQRPIVNFYYDQKIGKASLVLTKNDILPQGTSYTYGALELPFAHALACPSWELQKLKNCLFEKHKHFIGLAGCGLVVDKNGKILLTKRMSTMKTFPSAWVFPGGKVDPFESIEETVLREIKEETGIVIEKESEDKIMDEDEELFYSKNSVKCSAMRPFFLWESVYPTNLKYGMPQNQFVVIFFLIKLRKSSEEIKLKLQESEVERIVWIELDKLYDVIIDESKTAPQSFLSEMVKTYSGKNEMLEFPIGIFMDCYPNCFGEGLGEGHREALKAFVERKRKSNL